MEINKVSIEDGKNCANLIKFLTSGKWELSGDQAELMIKTKRWLQDIAVKMAADIKAQQSPQPTPQQAPAPSNTGFKIKGMGTIGSKPSKKKK